MRFKRYLVIAIALALCLALSAPTALAADSAKNETVYAALNSDGSVSRIYVVNQLLSEYIDYGEYTDIKNLSTTSAPSVEGDKIIFSDQNVAGGLYYQGTTTGELPVSLNISYTLNGKNIAAESLSGASGELLFHIAIEPNKKSSKAVRDGLMAQITVKLDTQYAANISAPDATVVTVGKSATISYVVLSGESGTLDVSADIQDFRMDPITVTLLKGTLASSAIDEKLDEFDDGFDDMLGGADDMVEGTTELKDGMTTLLDGMGDLSSGLGKLGSGGKSLTGGMSEYGKNLDDYLSGIQSIAQSSSDIQTGFDGFAENGTAVAQGVSDISDGLAGLSASSADLKALAQSLVSNSDPQVAALANGLLQTLGVVDGLSDGLKGASSGLNDYVAGVQQAAAGYGQFQTGLEGLSGGGSQLGAAYDEILDNVSEYTSGVSKSASGAKKIYSSIKNLPDDIQTLIDGQMEFRDGISTAKEEMNETTDMFIPDDDPPVSFASPEKNHPTSVQYILTTPAIEKKQEATQQQQEEQQNDNFLTRLAALFR
jgi:putative membrane protein